MSQPVFNDCLKFPPVFAPLEAKTPPCQNGALNIYAFMRKLSGLGMIISLSLILTFISYLS
jgi:hypothetical protein